MARIRTIKPDAFRSRHLAQVDRGLRWTFAGLWCLADDKGRLEDDPHVIWADLYLYDDATPEAVESDLQALVDVGLVCRYEARGRWYLHMPTFNRHQVINHPAPAKCPPCPLDHSDDDGTLFPPGELETPGVHQERYRNTQGVVPRERKEGKGREGKRTTAPNGAAAAQKNTVIKRANALASAYYEHEPMSNHQAVARIARKAIEAGRWSDEQIREALLALADERRTVTTDALRVQLDGPPKSGAPPDVSPW